MTMGCLKEDSSYLSLWTQSIHYHCNFLLTTLYLALRNDQICIFYQKLSEWRGLPFSSITHEGVRDHVISPPFSPERPLFSSPHLLPSVALCIGNRESFLLTGNYHHWIPHGVISTVTPVHMSVLAPNQAVQMTAYLEKSERFLYLWLRH